jgi:hypothetical protein
MILRLLRSMISLEKGEFMAMQRGKFGSGGKGADGEHLGLSFPKEQDAAFEAVLSFKALSPEPAGAGSRVP